jgi:hypothetical protein
VLEAVVALVGLADVDLGDPRVTDLGTTTVTVTRPGSSPVILSAYGLGIGDEYVGPDAAAARAALTGAIEKVAADVTGEQPWTPERLRITRYFRTEVPDPAATWPLAVPIAELLAPPTDGRLPCVVLDGPDALAVVAALDGGPALSSWHDGNDVAVLAIGPLVPGQPACGN